jgi:hypothetical protein
MTHARLQRQRGVQLHAGKARDDDLPVRLVNIAVTRREPRSGW